MNSNNVVGSEYLRTYPGKFKLLELGLNILTGCLVGIGYTGSRVNFYISAVLFGSIFSLFFLVCHVGRIFRAEGINQSRKEFIIGGILGLYMLIASLTVIVASITDPVFIQVTLGAIGGIIASGIYLADAFLAYKRDPMFCR